MRSRCRVATLSSAGAAVVKVLPIELGSRFERRRSSRRPDETSERVGCLHWPASPDVDIRTEIMSVHNVDYFD